MEAADEMSRRPAEETTWSWCWCSSLALVLVFALKLTSWVDEIELDDEDDGRQQQAFMVASNRCWLAASTGSHLDTQRQNRCVAMVATSVHQMLILR